MQVSKLVQANIDSLNSIKQLLLSISDEQYRVVIHPFTASMGKHLRHVTEHYQIFLDGLTPNNIDYDHRQRDQVEENERSSMLLNISNLCNQLKALPTKYSGCETISITTAVDEQAPSPTAASSIDRELIFLHSHSVHHYAIVSAILKLQNIQVDSNFGIASSTLIHESTQKCAP